MCESAGLGSLRVCDVVCEKVRLDCINGPCDEATGRPAAVFPDCSDCRVGASYLRDSGAGAGGWRQPNITHHECSVLRDHTQMMEVTPTAMDMK